MMDSERLRELLRYGRLTSQGLREASRRWAAESTRAAKREAELAARVAELEWERDEARALAERMRQWIDDKRSRFKGGLGNIQIQSETDQLLSLTGPQALAEVRAEAAARALEDYAHVKGAGGEFISNEVVTDMLAKAACRRAEAKENE